MRAGGSRPVRITTLAAFRVSSSRSDSNAWPWRWGLAPAPGGGAFTSNFMDVTGKVTSLSVSGGGAAVRGTATVTGLGAGPGRPLHGESHRRRSGATVLVTVSGLTFHEILTDGHFDVR